MKKTNKTLLFCIFSFVISLQGYAKKNADTPEVRQAQTLSQACDSTKGDKDLITEFKVLANGDTIYSYRYKAFDFGDIYNQAPTIFDNEKSTQNAVAAPQSTRFSVASVQSVNQSKSVGRIPFSEGITPSGGRTYSIPVQAAPTSSSAPQIGLTYNSQSGNGVAGFGWNISGLSAIAVTGKNIYYDSSPAPADLAKPSECAFSLDGTRLVPNTGSINEFQYETAQGFILVKKQLASNGNISYFTAKFPNGTTAQFGFTDNTEMRHTYPITELMDFKGYKINFEYIQSGNNYYISKIKYGSRALDTHLAEIHFTYVTRTDFAPVYISGESVSTNLLLKSIISYNKVNGTLQELRNYSLTHTLKEAQQLTQLDCSVGASSLNPLQFAYEYYPDYQTSQLTKESSVLLSSYFSSSSDAKPIYIRGKFIKNRFNDGIITYPGKFSTYDMTGAKVVGANSYKTYGSMYPADQSILIAPGLSFLSETQSITTEEGFQTITPADINGDGIDEIVKVNFNGLSENKISTILKITKYFVTDGNLTSQSFTVPVTGVINDRGETYSPISRSYYFGDFAGTGKMQLLTVSHNEDIFGNGKTSYFALIDIDGGRLIRETMLFGHASHDNGFIQALDVNGDGKTELCRPIDNGLEVYSLKENGFSILFTDTTATRSLFYKEELYGDLNGDGKIDILVPPIESYQNKVMRELQIWVPHMCPYCNGPEPITDVSSVNCRHCNQNIKEYYTNNQAYCRECNKTLQSCYPNDPMFSEALCCPTHGSVTISEVDFGNYVDNGNIWTAYLFTGKGFVKSDIPIINTEYREDYSLFDINDDGYADLLQVKNNQVTVRLGKNGVIQTNCTGTPQPVPSGTKIIPASVRDFYSMSHFICVENAEVNCYRFTRDEGKANLLTTLTDSYGVRYTNEYADMTGMGSNYISTNTLKSYPYLSFTAPVNLLRTSTVYKGDGYTPLSNMYYSYFGAVMHRTGLGFCGFEKVKTIDYVNNITTEEERNPQLFGVTTKITSPTAEATYSYFANMDISTKKANPQMYHSSETDKLTNTTQIRSYVYDAYNNPTYVSTSFDNINATTSVSTQTYYSSINSWLYLIGQPLLKTVTATRSGESWISKEEISYYPSRLPQSSITYTGSNGDKKTGETRWEYDENWNIYSEKSAAYDNTSFLGKTYEYDLSGNYVTAETNALNQTTTYGNFDKYGNAATVTDHKGNSTTRTFDEWGQSVCIAYPDSVIENVAVAWGGVGLYTVTKTATGKPTTITHYDELDREIRSGNKRFDGQWQYADKVYDDKGRVEKISLPYRSITSLWNAYTYDTYNRPLTLTEASGKITSWSYNGRSVTETKNGISSTKTKDASGELISVTDPGGTISYILRADGQPAGIMTNGVPTSFDYDQYGRRKSITDPSAGTQTFTEAYSENCKTATVTDANGKTITTRYDEYGRIKAIERPEFNTAYTYNTDGQIKSEISTNSTSKSFTYDALGRLSADEQVSLYGVFLRHSYSYSNGNLATKTTSTYMRSSATESYLYNNGHQVETKLKAYTAVQNKPEVSIWRLTGENDLGQPISSQTGSLARTYAYNAYGLPTSRTAGNIQNFSYNFDVQTGNLLSRTDNTRSLTENFGYDNLNRLTSINGQQMQYAENGNITTMPGTGTMQYSDIDKPYAITELTLTGNAVPMREQHLTYTSFQRPAEITEGEKKAEFSYNASGERICTQFSEGVYSSSQHMLFNNEYEMWDGNDASSKEILYVGGDAYSAPAVLVIPELDNPWELYYICRDYLGSITHVVNANGSLKQELSYDAWGRLRNPDNQVAYTPGSEPVLFLGRGYTGHEHLTAFGLINMNARLYDPALGRFLSPDPYVQAPDFSQSFNRYSYCVNNPLSYIDPSGEIVWFLPIAIGAIIGGTSGAMIGYANGAKGWNMFGYIAGGALIGGLSGGTASGVSALGGAAWWAGAAAGTVGGAGFSGLATNWNGESMLKGAAFGALSGFVGGGLGSAIGGGWGAFAGGSASSGLNTALSGSDLGQIGISMLVGGALSYGTYELTSYIAYKQANLSINNHQVTYKQFKTMQADYQRSRFWRKEYGGILTKNGNVVRAPAQNRHSLRVDFTKGMIIDANNDGGAATSYHTHWARGGVDYNLNNVDDIVSRANATYLATTSNGPSPGDIDGAASYFGGNQYLIDRNNFYYYNTATYANNSASLFRYFPMYWW